jgi:ATP-binding cassette subfamily F protein uup
VCDNVYTLDGGIRHLPGGIDQYLGERRPPAPTAGPAERAPSRNVELRAVRREVQRLEREIERRAAREQALEQEMAAHASDHTRLAELAGERSAVAAEREALEAQWLEAAEALEA